MKTIIGAEKILEQFDFFESYISKIEWSSDLFDLIITINYFWEDENSCKNKDIQIVLKECLQASFKSPQLGGIGAELSKSMAKSYVLYSIQGFDVKKECGKWQVRIYTTELNYKWLDALCSEILLNTDM